MVTHSKQQKDPEAGCIVYNYTQHVSVQTLRTYVSKYINKVTCTTPMENNTFAIITTIRLLCWDNNTGCSENTNLIFQAKEVTEKFLNINDLEQTIKLICQEPQPSQKA